MKPITRQDLVARLSDLRGAEFVTIVASTIPEMNRTAKVARIDQFGKPVLDSDGKPEFVTIYNPFIEGKGKSAIYHLRKTNTVNGQVNFLYDEAVLRQLEREGKSPESFKQGESWHNPVIRDDGTLTPFLKHKETGKLYFRFRRLATVGEPSFHLSNGKTIDKSEVEPFLVKSKHYANQGLSKTINFHSYKLENIKAVTMQDETFVVTD